MTGPGAERRRAILSRAADLATVEGLDGVSLGRLAQEMRMSKSGVQGLFGTKEGLQLAIVGTAAQIFRDRVLAKTEGADDGLPRLRELFHAWIDYLDTFEGGCFFVATATEFSARPGPVRTALLDVSTDAFDAVRKQAVLARRLGELDADTDTDQLIFELHGIVLEANLVRRFFARADAYALAHRAIDHRLAMGGGA